MPFTRNTSNMLWLSLSILLFAGVWSLLYSQEADASNWTGELAKEIGYGEITKVEFILNEYGYKYTLVITDATSVYLRGYVSGILKGDTVVRREYERKFRGNYHIYCFIKSDICILEKEIHTL